ncbi:Flp family type IVb pilin [Geomonas anaerohicana]|uniref:Flp family type IVb pilin n=1 Tax=Geomonas anaerohicana TaxID=2798583 RepID=A0ABS0YIB7_9BACT|nr:Flp family type IVb pilin [Geomonas anaerohicana]MBJ6751637.1 Flp family type IVb pilin [Geomonas anaerohicana]
MFEKLKKTGRKMKDALTSNRGQGLVEYALILVLIAIVVILAVRTLGTTTRSIFQNVNTELTK